jgi:hypothetical protein
MAGRPEAGVEHPVDNHDRDTHVANNTFIVDYDNGVFGWNA